MTMNSELTSLDAAPEQPAPNQDFLRYRAVCTASVVSLLLGALSVLAVLDWWLGMVPALGALIGVMALRQIARQPEELTGRGVAWTGITASLLFWIAGVSWLGYVYVTEVPDGYERISYSLLQPDGRSPGNPIPRSALDLDGRRVFIKGYVFPGAQQWQIKNFVLVRDNGTCCFGGPTPKLTDMIQVNLEDGLAVDYSTRVFKLAGVFRVEPSQAEGDLGTVLYHLDADYVK